MKRLIFIAAVSMAASCGLSEIGESYSATVSGTVWGGISDETEAGGALEQVCYITALDYQKGYDWRANQAKESVKCSLVVYADGRPVMKIPVGEMYETGDDPDMHRIIDGHLYTDYSTDAETVIKRDGSMLFRYSGRELICGMDVRGEDVYTLGQNRDGKGFSYRKNGEILMSRESGTIMGTLRNFNDTLSFAFCDRIMSSDGSVERYYAVREGTVTQVAVREDIVKVWDIVWREDEVVYLASVVGVTSPVLFGGNSMYSMPMPQGAALMSYTLAYAGDNLCSEVVYLKGKDMYTSVCMNGAVLKTFEKGMTMAALCVHEDGVCCVSNSLYEGSPGVIYRCGDQYAVPEGYLCVGRNAIAMVNGILHVGLSSTKDGRPVVWKDGQLDTLKINGYISSVFAR